MARAAYAILPRSLFDDERFLCLPESAAHLLLRIYGTCDVRGRFAASPIALARRTGLMRPDLGDELASLESAGFVRTYQAEGLSCGVVTGYDEALTRRMRERRGAGEFPPAPWATPEEVASWSGERADKGRSESGVSPESERAKSGVTNGQLRSESGVSPDQGAVKQEQEQEQEHSKGGPGETGPSSDAERPTTAPKRKRSKRAKPPPPEPPAWDDLPTGLCVWLQRWCDEMADASAAMADGPFGRDEMLRRMWPKLAKVRERFGDRVMAYGIAQQIDADKGWGTGSKADGVKYLTGVCRNATEEEVEAWRARMRGQAATSKAPAAQMPEAPMPLAWGGGA